MAEAYRPKVVIMGTNDGAQYLDLSEIMCNIQTKSVPIKLLHGIFLTDFDNTVTRVDTRHVDTPHLDLKVLNDFLDRKNLSETTQLVEIVLDMEKTQVYLHSLSTNFLSKFFPATN